jgi:DNA-binding NtrC family response regulator
MMTAYGGIESAVEAMKIGAYDFVTKPVNIDRLDLLIKRALHGSEIERENVRLREQIDKRYGLENFVGDSPAMAHVLDTIRQVAPSRATVLITGESGTGKELAAHAIHRLSPRHRGPFVAVHCAALSPQLLESELFGHEKGAFTGAGERRIGRFEQAAGGTLFLDEIGEIDAATQVKILRVLGERTFERVGGNKPIAADVRLLAATNRDLAKMVAEGNFREDLFFRLNVVQLHLPPLRDRREDIPLLAVHFLREAAKDNDKPFRELTSEAMKCLVAYDWPGNVRELRAAIEHGVVMAGGAKITLRDLPPTIRATAPGAVPRGPLPLNLGDTELSLIRRALEECQRNRTLAAQKLGISRRTLHRKLREHPELESD